MDNNKKFSNQVIRPCIATIKNLPERNAFCINNIFYTYKQFGNYISKIRFAVKQLNKHELYIGLVANDDIETYASIIALWLEGKAYVPLHPNQPFERCSEIINQVKIKTIVDSSSTSKFTDYSVIYTNSLVFTEDCLEIDDSIDEKRDVYILFTSGSTGKPKGVTINRKNIGAFMDSFWASGVKITPEDKCLQCFDLTFDISVQSFLAPLLRGACVYTIPHDQTKYSYVFLLLEEHHITFAVIAPSMLRYLRPYFEEIYSTSMKYCLMSAEASATDLVMEWQNCIPNAEIFDCYGPTETTIYCTYYKINKGGNIKSLNGMLSIGNPMKNVEAIVVDENLNILPRGEKGELCIAGDHVSPGYWNNPEKNALSFFEKEHNGKTKRFYHTGDLCFIDDDSDIMLFGRIDSQTKIQGYRVELGEIEFHVREFLQGDNAVVLTYNNSIGNTDLALFVERESVDASSLTDYLKTKLPAYMIPSKVITKREFPLNSNSKVDKIKLKEKLTV